MFDAEPSLDPSDWEGLRAQGHRMLDDMLDYLADIRQRPVWQPSPPAASQAFRTPLPQATGSLSEAYGTFTQHVLPYTIGNAHPGFMGWVHGGGSVVGMLAEMLAAGLNANLGGREQMPIAVERQITQWMRELFEFPASASGLFVTGSSMANLMAIWIARYQALGKSVRAEGMHDQPQLVAYCSRGAHGCIDRAMDLAGLGTDNLRKVGVDRSHRMDVGQLSAAIEADQRAGRRPFCVIATSGTVDVGSIDDLSAIARVAEQHGLWFHVDGACGALGKLSATIAKKLKGIEAADSIALDFHKWGQVPYDAGFLLVRDGTAHHDTFAAPAAYLRRETRGMAAGSPWPCDFGPDLSRSFKALKVWFALQVYGAERLGAMMDHTCALAEYLAERVSANAELELAAQVALNIVCFRYRAVDSDRVNAEIVVRVQESGVAAPSSTIVDDRLAIRAAIFNHRAQPGDVDSLLEAVLAAGHQITKVSDRKS